MASAMGDEAFDISFCLRSGKIPPVAGKRVGVVFPIHSWRAPRPVMEFLSHLEVPEGMYCFAVCTCGDDAGKAMQNLARVFGVDAAWSITMPNTYVPMFSLDTDEVASSKIRAARKLIPEIARLVQDELLLDDINDMSSLLLTMCNQKGVLINGQINHINDGDAQDKEEKIKKRLYNLFIKAEELVYRQMMKSGNGHWFQYGQVDDRGELLLHGKEADQRFRKLYGPIEYQKRRLNIDKSFKKDNNSENFSSDWQKAQDENDVNQF